jgi:hypothetical protein
MFLYDFEWIFLKFCQSSSSTANAEQILKASTTRVNFIFFGIFLKISDLVFKTYLKSIYSLLELKAFNKLRETKHWENDIRFSNCLNFNPKCERMIKILLSKKSLSLFIN